MRLVTTLALGAAVLALALLCSPGLRAESRTCVSAVVDEPFYLPDAKSQYAAGRIRICSERGFSPVAGLHTISTGVDRRMYLSRRFETEASPEEARTVLVFQRGSDHKLWLLGYAVRSHDRMLLYWLHAPGSGGRIPASPELPDEPERRNDHLQLIAAEIQR